jgi:hypothetical protein
MDAAGIAALLTQGIAPPVGSSDMGFHTGVIKSWDESSGVNVVTVQGVDFSNLGCVQGGVGVLYQPGDVVAVMRFQTRYFVFGKIAAPGAGAANQIRSAAVNTAVNNVNVALWNDLPGSPGPTLSNVYIGSSRRCLVLMTCLMDVSGVEGYMSVSISGDSVIAPSGNTGLQTGFIGIPAGAPVVTAQSAANFVLTAADGLNSGFHTFTAKYGVFVSGGTGVNFLRRSMTVIPF